MQLGFNIDFKKRTNGLKDRGNICNNLDCRCKQFVIASNWFKKK